MFRRHAILVFIGATSACGQPARQLSEEELARLLENPEKLFLLDVREPQEIKDHGSVPGYVNIPIGQLESRLGEVPKGKPVLAL